MNADLPSPSLPDPRPLSDYLLAIQSGFERGSYREVLTWVEAALRHYPQSGSLRLWQALTIEALGQTTQAIELMQMLVHHPDPEIAQQAKYLVYIWKAPRLQRPPAWLSEIPDLSQLADSAVTLGSRLPPLPQQRSRTTPPPPVVNSDPALSEQSDRTMIWMWLAVVASVIGLGWLLAMI
ncbi:MAG: hypothetical protein NW237_13920 [Cyanobacteriota bacterium]|nr:hypothetical protein [Cyanobacteriota bacterium]